MATSTLQNSGSSEASVCQTQEIRQDYGRLDANPQDLSIPQARGLHHAYDDTNLLFRFLKAYGWGHLLNLGYFDYLSLLSLFSLPIAQRRLVRKAVGLLGLKGGERVLDIACGRGWSSSYIAGTQPGGEVVGMDLLSHHVQICQKLYDSVPRLRFQRGDATDMPFDENSFDAMICIEAAFHFDRSKFLSEASRVLRKGGRLVIVDFMWRARHGAEVLNHPDVSVARSVWRWNDFDSVDEYHAKAAGAGFAVESLHDWSFHVTTALYSLCQFVTRLCRNRIMREALFRINPHLKGIKPSQWPELENIVLAHNFARRHSKYIALTLEKRG